MQAFDGIQRRAEKLFSFQCRDNELFCIESFRLCSLYKPIMSVPCGSSKFAKYVTVKNEQWREAKIFIFNTHDKKIFYEGNDKQRVV